MSTRQEVMDSNSPILKVTDLKQFVYCPRIIYYTYVLPIPRPVTHKMDFGKFEHIELDRLEKRRKLVRYGLEEGKRVFHTALFSERLGLEGKLDLHIVKEKEYYPVEFKHSSGVYFNQKLQIAGYALLLEERMSRPVRDGFLYLIPKKEIVPIPITQDLRDYVHETLLDIRRLIHNQRYPKPTRQKNRCQECEFRRYCRDIEVR